MARASKGVSHHRYLKAAILCFFEGDSNQKLFTDKREGIGIVHSIERLGTCSSRKAP